MILLIGTDDEAALEGRLYLWSFKWFEDLQAPLPNHSWNLGDNDTTSKESGSQSWRFPYWPFVSSPLTTDLVLESQVHLNKWLFMFPESELTVTWESLHIFKPFFSALLGKAQLTSFPFISSASGFGLQEHLELFGTLYLQLDLEMSEVLVVFSLSSYLFQISIPKFCLNFAFIYPLIHLTCINGASTVSGPCLEVQSMEHNQRKLCPLPRYLVFPNARASPSVDALLIQ
jgi:hypothetical protein